MNDVKLKSPDLTGAKIATESENTWDIWTPSWKRSDPLATETADDPTPQTKNEFSDIPDYSINPKILNFFKKKKLFCSLPNDKLQFCKQPVEEALARVPVLKCAKDDLSAVPIIIGKKCKNKDAVITKNANTLKVLEPAPLPIIAPQDDIAQKVFDQMVERHKQDSELYTKTINAYKGQLTSAIECIEGINTYKYPNIAKLFDEQKKKNSAISLVVFSPPISELSLVLRVINSQGHTTYYNIGTATTIGVPYDPAEIADHTSFSLTMKKQGRWYLDAPSGVPGVKSQVVKDLSLGKMSLANFAAIASGQLNPIIEDQEQWRGLSLYQVFKTDCGPIYEMRQNVREQYKKLIDKNIKSPDIVELLKESQETHEKQFEQFDAAVNKNIVKAKETIKKDFGEQAVHNFEGHSQLKPFIFIDKESGIPQVHYIFEMRFNDGRGALFDPINSGLYIGKCEVSWSQQITEFGLLITGQTLNSLQILSPGQYSLLSSLANQESSSHENDSHYKVLEQKNKFGRGFIISKSSPDYPATIVDATDWVDDAKIVIGATGSTISGSGGFITLTDPAIGIPTVAVGASISSIAFGMDYFEDKQVTRNRDNFGDAIMVISLLSTAAFAFCHLPGIKSTNFAAGVKVATAVPMLAMLPTGIVYGSINLDKQINSINNADLPSDIKQQYIHKAVWDFAINEVLFSIGPTALGIHQAIKTKVASMPKKVINTSDADVPPLEAPTIRKRDKGYVEAIVFSDDDGVGATGTIGQRRINYMQARASSLLGRAKSLYIDIVLLIKEASSLQKDGNSNWQNRVRAAQPLIAEMNDLLITYNRYSKRKIDTDFHQYVINVVTHFSKLAEKLPEHWLNQKRVPYIDAIIISREALAQDAFSFHLQNTKNKIASMSESGARQTVIDELTNAFAQLDNMQIQDIPFHELAALKNQFKIELSSLYKSAQPNKAIQYLLTCCDGDAHFNIDYIANLKNPNDFIAAFKYYCIDNLRSADDSSYQMIIDNIIAFANRRTELDVIVLLEHVFSDGFFDTAKINGRIYTALSNYVMLLKGDTDYLLYRLSMLKQGQGN
ncbi:MAG: hypothetical protein JW841_16860 [Deltaproteobacteria bacterium]|nr:hypothetical protein [Deltaproteobacteria bacterium]